jgi:hypothetical protein
MPRGAPSRDNNKDCIHCQHIEQGRTFREAAKHSPTTYCEPLNQNKICTKARARFNYIKGQFANNKRNYYKIKNSVVLEHRPLTVEDSSLARAKEEQDLLDEELSYCSSQRDQDDTSLATTKTISKKQSAKKTSTRAVKKTPLASISIPSATTISAAADCINIMDNKKYISKFNVTAVVLLRPIILAVIYCCTDTTAYNLLCNIIKQTPKPRTIVSLATKSLFTSQD